MKFTLSWLKEHLETTATLDEIVVGLTKLGLEVEGVEDPAAKLKGFGVARVLTADPHPRRHERPPAVRRPVGMRCEGCRMDSCLMP